VEDQVVQVPLKLVLAEEGPDRPTPVAQLEGRWGFIIDGALITTRYGETIRFLFQEQDGRQHVVLLKPNRVRRAILTYLQNHIEAIVGPVTFRRNGRVWEIVGE
jgi:hypothetical protein